MSSSTYDARERFLTSFGIGLEAAKLAINTEPAARAIFDHAVAFIEKHSPTSGVAEPATPKKGVVHPETARRVLDIGFKYGVDWSQGPYGSMGLPSSMTEAMERAWHQFEQGVSQEPVEPATPKNEATRIVENRIAASTGVSPSAQERTPPIRIPSDLTAGKEPSVERLESYFQAGVVARDNRSANPFPAGTISYYMHMKGWLFRDIQILAIISDQAYGNQMQVSGHITEEQLLDEQRRWRAGVRPSANKE